MDQADLITLPLHALACEETAEVLEGGGGGELANKIRKRGHVQTYTKNKRKRSGQRGNAAQREGGGKVDPVEFTQKLDTYSVARGP